MFEFDLFSWHYPLLILAGFIAGFINTMAGGGSLLTLPLLIFMGLPPAMANGTNRIAIFMSAFSATAGFKSKGVSNYPFNAYLGFAEIKPTPPSFIKGFKYDSSTDFKSRWYFYF